jgi:hypothetical protein
VKVKALTLAEMQAFLQKRTDEDETAKHEIQTLMDEINGYDYVLLIKHGLHQGVPVSK